MEFLMMGVDMRGGGRWRVEGGGGGRNDDDDEEAGGSGGGRMGLLGRFCWVDDCAMRGVGRGFSICWWVFREEWRVSFGGRGRRGVRGDDLAGGGWRVEGGWVVHAGGGGGGLMEDDLAGGVC